MARHTQEERQAAYFAWQYKHAGGIQVAGLDGDLLVADRTVALRLPEDHPLFQELPFKITQPRAGDGLVYRPSDKPKPSDRLLRIWYEQTTVRGRSFRPSPWCLDREIQLARVLSPVETGWPVLVDRALCDLIAPDLSTLTTLYTWHEGHIIPGYSVGPVLVVNRRMDSVCAILMPLWAQEIAQLAVPSHPLWPVEEPAPAGALQEVNL